MNYVYFVSFSHTRGFGRVEIILNKPITSSTVISEIEDWLRQDGTESPCVSNFILLRTEEP